MPFLDPRAAAGAEAPAGPKVSPLIDLPHTLFGREETPQEPSSADWPRGDYHGAASPDTPFNSR